MLHNDAMTAGIFSCKKCNVCGVHQIFDSDRMRHCYKRKHANADGYFNSLVASNEFVSG